MYSTINKLTRADSNYQYHLKAFEYFQPSQAPPRADFNY
ncbi:hypothetical protein MNB_ARC-1_164 [hydrothermal vent metagenome]|uniref:Uncharacterized protein n=1 Tax=hydrothermal vent metagenome TaxID=652676 RepID=A0A3B1E6T4_9ZZZZ